MSTFPKSRLISSESVSEYEAWVPPVVRNPDAQKKENARLKSEEEKQNKITADTLESLQEQARKEGFEKGYNEGINSASDEVADVVKQFTFLINNLARPFECLDDKVIDEVGQLAALIARQIVRRELKTEAGQIVSLVRESVSYLPVASQNIRVMLHPEDAEIVTKALSMNEHEQRWELVQDPVITRGGCKVVTESARIDATVESQLNAVIANVLGDERQDNSDDT